MNTIDWKRKLSSRKLWAAVVSFVTLVLTARGYDSGSVQQIASIIMAGGSLIAYIIAEGWVDAAAATNPTTIDKDGQI